MAADTLVVLQLNVEGLTRAKRDIVHHLADTHEANIIVLQETHAVDEDKLPIEGFNVSTFIPHKKHGIATYTRDGLRAKSIRQSPSGSSIAWSIIEVNGVDVANIYKPPPSSVTFRALPKTNSPSIVCGDLNSRHTNWGYPDCNPNGEAVDNWAETSNLHLLYDAKAPPSFFSKRHKT